MPVDKSRRRFIARAAGAASAMALAGCDRLSSTEWFPKVLRSGESLSRGVHRVLGTRPSMAQEFTEADLSPFFRSNGTSMPASLAYQALARNGFADWSLTVDGLVERPTRITLAELRAMPRRTQITRHDCVEGWSAIGKWTGVQLSTVLAEVRPRANARYAVFHCADNMGYGPTPELYYESIDMDDAIAPANAARVLAERRAPANCQRRPDPAARRASARVQAREVRDARRTGRQLCTHQRRQGRVLGRQRVPVVRRYLKQTYYGADSSSRP